MPWQPNGTSLSGGPSGTEKEVGWPSHSMVARGTACQSLCPAEWIQRLDVTASGEAPSRLGERAVVVAVAAAEVMVTMEAKDTTRG